jgi:hypothetical protein
MSDRFRAARLILGRDAFGRDATIYESICVGWRAAVFLPDDLGGIVVAIPVGSEKLCRYSEIR